MLLNKWMHWKHYLLYLIKYFWVRDLHNNSQSPTHVYIRIEEVIFETIINLIPVWYNHLSSHTAHYWKSVKYTGQTNSRRSIPSPNSFFHFYIHSFFFHIRALLVKRFRNQRNQIFLRMLFPYLLEKFP